MRKNAATYFGSLCPGFESRYEEFVRDGEVLHRDRNVIPTSEEVQKKHMMCNHIVWDAVEVAEFTREHKACIPKSSAAMHCIVEQIVAKWDERRDGFVKVIMKAMHKRLVQTQAAFCVSGS